MARITEVAPPTGEDLAEWLNLDPATDGLSEAMSAALEAQAARCVVSPYLEPLRVAALRRAAREWHSRSMPLGFTDNGEFGLARVGRDWLIAELEADYLRGGFDAEPSDESGLPVDGDYLPLAGGTLTGPLMLADSPLEPLEAATKKYVDDARFLSGVAIEAFEYRLRPDALSTGSISFDTYPDPSTATAVLANRVDHDSYDRSEFWSQAVAGDWLNIHMRSESGNAYRWDITGPPVLEGEVWRIPVTPYDQIGEQLTSGDRVLAIWRAGAPTPAGWLDVATEADLPASAVLGQKARVRAGLGLQVMVWNGSSWAVSPESDTGIHDPAPFLQNGWSAPSFLPITIRRNGHSARLDIYNLDGTAATSHNFLSWSHQQEWAYRTGDEFGLTDGEYRAGFHTPQMVATPAYFLSSGGAGIYASRAASGLDPYPVPMVDTYLGAVLEYPCHGPWPTAPPTAPEAG